MTCPPVGEPSLRQAAVFTLHWSRRDIEAIVLLLAEIEDLETAQDLIVALLLMRERPMEDISRLVSYLPVGSAGE